MLLLPLRLFVQCGGVQEIERIIDLLTLAEKLKCEMRHSWCSDGRRESVAEHSWQMALMAMLLYRHLQEDVDIAKALKMVLVHDLVEAEAGDVPFFDKSERKLLKAQREKKAIENIRAMLNCATGQEIHDLWWEFEEGRSNEARFARALDHLEVQFQHNLADFSTWEEVEYGLVYTKMDTSCAHDPFLKSFAHALRVRAEAKMEANGIDTARVKRQVEQEF